VEQNPEHNTAAELLADWRAAGRDTSAAQAAVRVASLVLEAAKAAEEAALETEAAAKAAQEAVERALLAASSAKRAAARAAEAAQILISGAEGDQARASQDLDKAERSEEVAGDRFHSAQEHGFPKERE
jgi:hypothetical protein